jgi:FkbM family methyltransferase
MNRLLITLKGFIPVRFKSFLKKFRKYNSYNNLDKKMLKYINYKKGFYIDCGANDGVNQSTTWYFEKYLNWRGILVEPIPFIYEELKKNRSKNNYFFNCALVSSSFKGKKIDITYNKNDTLTAEILNNNTTHKKKVETKTITLNKILKKTKLPKFIDFFSLDVEGYEFEVLNGIDFKKFQFKYILIETSNPKKLNNFFLKKNYLFIKRLSDYNSKEKPDYGDYLYKNKKIN